MAKALIQSPSIGATDFARSLPSHVAARTCGHTEEIAKEHYRQVGDSDLDLAIEKLGHSKLAQKLAHEGDLSGPESSLDDSEALGPEMEKPQVSLGFDMLCQLMADAGLFAVVGEEGSEQSHISQGKAELSQSVSIAVSIDATKLDVSRLWKSLSVETQKRLLRECGSDNQSSDAE